jgi:hypothetical protein
MHEGEQKHASCGRSHGVFYSSSHHEYVPGLSHILLTKRTKNDLSLDHVHADRARGAVGFHVSARRDGDKR